MVIVSENTFTASVRYCMRYATRVWQLTLNYDCIGIFPMYYQPF
jgi:hypothetical protein